LKNEKTTRHIRLNKRALILAVILVAIAIPAVLVGWSIQSRRLGFKAIALAQDFEKAGEPGKAIRTLSHYLELEPDDRKALALLARLQAETARDLNQILSAASVNQRLLSLDPNAPDSQDVRRRLVELYVRFGELFRATNHYNILPDQAMRESRAAVAETVANQLFGPGKTNIPKDYRLRAQAEEGLITPGNPKRGERHRSALEDAIADYTKALEGDPADALAAGRLAQIYFQRQHDRDRAQQVLDNLLKARETADVRWVRYQFFTTLKDRKQAALELDAAKKLAPESVTIRVKVAEEALRKGDVEAAKNEINALPKRSQETIQVQLIRGQIAFAERHPDEAITDWQQGLLMTGGSDAQLTWQLAYTFLQMGDLTRARPLIARYRELGGEGSEPLLALLEAELDLKSGWPGRAVYSMERIKNRIGEALKVPLLLTLGHAYEALWDIDKALEAYHLASEFNPEAQEPRTAAIQLRIRQQKLAEARIEIERGLQVIPDAATLLLTKAVLLLREQAQLPRERRSWDAFLETLELAAKQAPNSPSLALLQTDFLTLEGRIQEAIVRLKTAVDGHPKIDTIAIAYANSLARAGQVEEALRVLDQASSPDAAGDHATLRINRANLLLGLGRGRTARDALVHNIDRLPINERALIWRTLGQLEASQGNLDAARKAYLEYARLLPDDPQPRLDLLVLAMNSSDDALVHSIVEDLRRRSEERDQAQTERLGTKSGAPTASRDLVWRLCRAQELVWSTRATAKQPPGRDNPALEEADQLLKAILIDAPEMPIARILYGDLLERRDRPGDAEKAAAEYRHALERGADSALPRLVNLLTRLGKTKDLAELRKLTSTKPFDTILSLASLRQGDSQTAAQILSQTTSGETESLASQLWRVSMLSRIGKTEEAESVLKAMVAQHPDDLEARLRLVRAQSLRGDIQEVTASIERIRNDFKAENQNPDLLEARCRWAANDLPKADAAFKAALEGSQYDPTISRFASSYYEEQGRRDEAAACLRRAHKAHPNDRPTARALALLLAITATDERSWEGAHEVLGPEPKQGETVEDRMARAVVLSYAPNPARKEEAITHLEALIEDIPVKSPQAPLARSLLAGLLIKTGRAAQAAQFASISANSGVDPAAISLYAEALIQARKWDEAQVQIDRLLALGPQSPRAAQLQVQLIQSQAGPDQAVQMLEASVDNREKSPNFANFEREVLRTLDQIGAGAAEATERVARRIAQRTPASSWMLARLQARKQKFAEALESCRQAVEHYDGTFDNLLQVGEIAMQIALAKKTDPELSASAEAVLKDAQIREPSNIPLLICRAMVAHLKAKYDDEIRFYREILKQQPSNAVALNNIAWSLSEGTNQASEAMTFIDALLQQGGKSAQSLDTRGVILARLGRYDEAIRDLAESNRLAPSEVTVFHLAVACHLAGREDDFRKFRDNVRKAGLKPEQLDATELAAFETLIKP
jgi:tetratricopeptide (TPR) repeat protein